ncbi:FliM/FliN family flagellar motor C-terminal domain-containing protein [Ruegeria sp. 2012CJ41-6]|uniref:FliM/FliN family flagellar motor C-terminal domain-containing protein n=1 Tax=Ruegeria spongiae TaxID=2942209 RepID=A0ABT0Q4N2_9RHOB|nr:FliM/FliN family flagellar motor C-terminal domain-containing protein [Ruegeria spongiae]MCL6284821.1 FliM/FliN family flagellar motor C-terminal domain-containing protein [Ruegeria spongiae]
MDDTQSTKPDFAGPFTSVPVEITVSVGRARPLVRDLIGLGENAILTLDKRVEDPVELFVGDQLVARGQLEELEGDQDGRLAVRLIEIVTVPDGKE